MNPASDSLARRMSTKGPGWRLILSIVIMPMVSACAVDDSRVSGAGLAAADAMPHVKRPNLVVVDIERSLKIYRDILGFEASDIRTGGPDSYSYPVFNVPTEAKLRFVSLDEPREARVLNLTEISGATLVRPPEAPHASAIVIGITDLRGKFGRLSDLGLTITDPKVADGVDFRFVEQAFIDYDGHLIVCYEVIDEP